jgi:2-desacetyl-2-hydroxyethyl bacteriochlorophyllide A dehydrogenase
VRCTAEGIVTVEQDPPEGPGWRLHVTSAGICGSDLHAVAAGRVTVVPGHEFGGTLDDGRLVAVRPHRSCGHCTYCGRGAEHLRRDIMRAFHGSSIDGGLADEVLVAPESVVEVPATVDPRTVALVEPIAVAVHAVNRGRPQPDDRVLVIGGGSIGLLCAVTLHDRGIPVDVVARHPAQRDTAAALGAGLDPSARYQVVIDALGTRDSFHQAISCADRGGRIVLVGLPWDGVNISAAAVLKEVDVVPSIFYGHHDGVDEFEEAAALLSRRPELPELLVTHRFRIEDAADAFWTAGTRAAGVIKVHILP